MKTIRNAITYAIAIPIIMMAMIIIAPFQYMHNSIARYRALRHVCQHCGHTGATFRGIPPAAICNHCYLRV